MCAQFHDVAHAAIASAYIHDDYICCSNAICGQILGNLATVRERENETERCTNAVDAADPSPLMNGQTFLGIQKRLFSPWGCGKGGSGECERVSKIV